MRNLYQETIEALKQIGKTFDDVLYICGDNYQITKENYLNVAKATQYYGNFCGADVAPDLRIIGDDFILIREEYDGSEWFQAVNIRPPKDIREIKHLTSSSVKENETQDYDDTVFWKHAHNSERNNYDYYLSYTIQELNWYNESCEQ